MIDKEEVKHICDLANIKLSDEKQEKITEELVDILDYIEKLDELDTDEVHPTAYPVPLKNVLRQDETRPSLDREEVIKNAPESSNGQFKVPPIMNEEDSQ